jgi:hypothetical protein
MEGVAFPLFLFDLFRSFLPLHNPIGFGASDFIEIALATILVVLVLAWRQILPACCWLARHPKITIAILAALPIALRLLLLPHYPLPTPAGSDDFSYLLLADTLSHFRLANPSHPMHQFFEAIFVLQQPTYSSIFPLGQGMVLTLGWTGVLLSAGAFTALCYWMLRGWTTPLRSLLGGFLSVAQFGPLCEWINSYWGGYPAACAGCLIFGAIPRKRGLLLGFGIAILWLTRPFECVLITVALACLLLHRRWFPRAAIIPVLCALSLSAVQNRAVTGNWTTMPYTLSRFQYGVPASFTIQPNPIPHLPLTAEQQLDYQAQSAVHGPSTDSPNAYWHRLLSRLTFYRFFLLVPLLLTPLFFWRDRRILWAPAVILFLALGTNFYPYFYPHYVAVLACLFLLLAVFGLAAMKRELAYAAILLCAAHALFWYTLHWAGTENQRRALSRFENWDYINLGDPEGRLAINRELVLIPGPKLVFVRYGSIHGFHEWIHNAADIDSSEVVWAADLGPETNMALRNYFPKRHVLLVEPDAHPPRLTDYR